LCVIGGIIALNTRPKSAPKDFSTLKRDLLDLKRASIIGPPYPMGLLLPDQYISALQKLEIDARVDSPHFEGPLESNVFVMVKLVVDNGYLVHKATRYLQRAGVDADNWKHFQITDSNLCHSIDLTVVALEQAEQFSIP
jgi:hypothetical protein